MERAPDNSEALADETIIVSYRITNALEGLKRDVFTIPQSAISFESSSYSRTISGMHSN